MTEEKKGMLLGNCVCSQCRRLGKVPWSSSAALQKETALQQAVKSLGGGGGEGAQRVSKMNNKPPEQVSASSGVAGEWHG